VSGVVEWMCVGTLLGPETTPGVGLSSGQGHHEEQTGRTRSTMFGEVFRWCGGFLVGV
jgi:hypothetical protein